MEAMEALNELINAIKNTEEYKQYHNELERIKMDCHLYQRVCEYRKRCIALHISCEQNSFEEVTAIRSEFDDVLKNKNAMNFMVTEQKLLKMVKKINGQVLEAAGLDVEFLQEDC